MRDVGHESRFESAISIGLAAQACYWATAAHKVEVMRWVVSTLAGADVEYSEGVWNDAVASKPLLAFVLTYLLGRDAVGGGSIARVAKEMVPPKGAPLQEERQVFWCVVGLLEAGHVTEAVEIMKRYRPKDLRRLLALDLGLKFYLHV